MIEPTPTERSLLRDLEIVKAQRDEARETLRRIATYGDASNRQSPEKDMARYALDGNLAKLSEGQE